MFSCPRLKEDGRTVDVWTCHNNDGYRWQHPDKAYSVGHILPTDHATVSSYDELEQAFRQLKQNGTLGRCPIRPAV